MKLMGCPEYQRSHVSAERAMYASPAVVNIIEDPHE
jgi:hypothetical protein